MRWSPNSSFKKKGMLREMLLMELQWTGSMDVQFVPFIKKMGK